MKINAMPTVRKPHIVFFHEELSLLQNGIAVFMMGFVMAVFEVMVGGLRKKRNMGGLYYFTLYLHS